MTYQGEFAAGAQAGQIAQQLPCYLRHPYQLIQHQRCHVVGVLTRNQCLAVVMPFQRILTKVDDSIVHRLTKERLHRERITPGFVKNNLCQFAMATGAGMQPPRQPAANAFHAERLRRQRHKPRRGFSDPQQKTGNHRTRYRFALPESEHQHKRPMFTSSDQRFQQLQRGIICPVNIINQHHQRATRRGKSLNQRTRHLVKLLAGVRGVAYHGRQRPDIQQLF